MTTRKLVGLSGIAMLLIGAVAASVAVAKKPDKPGNGSGDTPPPPVSYQIHWLIAGENTRILSVNDSGTVVGYSTPSGYAEASAFLCANPAAESPYIIDLPDNALPTGATGILRTARRINSAGRIAGLIDIDQTGDFHDWEVYAWDYPNGTFWPLLRDDLEKVAGPVDSFWISDMNEDGIVLGGFDRPDHGGRSCFVWMPGSEPIVVRGLAYPDEPYDTPSVVMAPSSISDVLHDGNNAYVKIAGEFADGKYHVYWYQLDLSDQVAGTVVWATRNVLPGNAAPFYGRVAINNDGTIISADIMAKGDARPSRFDLVSGNDWELLAGRKMRGGCQAINNGGQICGLVQSSPLLEYSLPGFVYHPNRNFGFWQLDDLTCDSDGPQPLGKVHLQDISDVADHENDWGTLVGYQDTDDQTQEIGVVLIPEPVASQ